MCVLLLGIHSDSFMNRLKMYGQIALLSELPLSLIASIIIYYWIPIQSYVSQLFLIALLTAALVEGALAWSCLITSFNFSCFSLSSLPIFASFFTLSLKICQCTGEDFLWFHFLIIFHTGSSGPDLLGPCHMLCTEETFAPVWSCRGHPSFLIWRKI